MASASAIRRSCLAVLIIGTGLTDDTACAGQRFPVPEPGTGEVYCSILLPLGWFPESDEEEDDPDEADTRNVRVAFTPVKGIYPLLLVDVGEPQDKESALAAAQSVKARACLDEGANGTQYFDPERQLLWTATDSPNGSNITVHMLQSRRFGLQFVKNDRLDSRFQGTVLDIIDTIQFSPESVAPTQIEAAVAVERFKDVERIPFVLTAADVGGIEYLQWKIAAVVLTVLLLMVIVERVLKSRREAERIDAAEVAIQERLSSRRRA